MLRQLNGAERSDSSGRFGVFCELSLSDVSTYPATYKNNPELSFRPEEKNSRLGGATVATRFQ